ncbi:hypothetical protein HNP99_000083 [Flavobacterium sp. 28A]|nr:hypothetical protein [Flavobacterium sp. 28A]
MKTSLWLSLDDEGENDLGVGGYIYSFNNPINFTDPDGNWPDIPIWNSLVNRAKSAAKSYVAHKIDNIVTNSRNYVNQKINSVKASISKTISKIENYEGGDYMLSNGSGGSSGDQSLIRKGGRTDVEMLVGSGLVQAGSFASSKRDGVKYNGSVKMTLKLIKETVKGAKIGDKVAGKFEANGGSGLSSTSTVDSNNAMIDMKLEKNTATGTTGWSLSQVNTRTKDTTVDKSQKGIIDKMNKLNLMRAEQKVKKDNAELQKKINYYKE